MSEPAAPSADLLTQMMLQNAPKTPLEMRSHARRLRAAS